MEGCRCEICGELLPPYSRVCPNCSFSEYFSRDCRCYLSPMPFLDVMRGYLDEILALRPIIILGHIVDPEMECILSVESSYEIVEGQLLAHFGRNDDVVEATNLIYDELSDIIERRQRMVTLNRWLYSLLGVTAVAILIIYLFITL